MPCSSSSAHRRAKILLINKIDLMENRAVADRPGRNQRADFAATFMISALNGDGVGDVKNLARRKCAGKALGFTPRTRSPMRRCVSLRRKSPARRSTPACTMSCHIGQRWRPTNGKSARTAPIRISKTIYVERESQRKIVLGKHGRMIKTIGTDARQRNRGRDRRARAFVSVRQGAGATGPTMRALWRHGSCVPEGITMRWTDEGIVLRSGGMARRMRSLKS